MTARHILLFLTCLIGQTVLAQNWQLDSLQQLIENTSDPNQQLDILWESVAYAEKNDKHQVEAFTNQIQKIAEMRNDSTLWFEAFSRKAAANRWIGNYAQSIEEFTDCYRYFKQHGDTNLLSFTLNHLGAMHVFMGYHSEAQKYMLEHYELEKQRGDPKKIAGTLNGLAIFYSNINQSEKALERYSEALKLYEEADDTLGRANIHANMGLLLIDENRLDEAEHHIMMQGKLDTLLQTQWGLGFFFNFLGSLREKQGRLKEAYDAYLRSLQIRENLESHYNVSESRASIASLLFTMKKYEEAAAMAQMVIENMAATQSLSHQQRAYRVLAKSNEAMGKYNEALKYHKNYKAISDSILNREMHETIAEKDAKFELAKQKNTISLLDARNHAAEVSLAQQQKTILYVSMALVAIALLSLILFVLSRKYLGQKKELAVALSHKDILLREIHHRVKNNLQIISSLLSLQGRSVTDASVQQAINDGKSRVRSMALIHQNLYQRENLTGVNVRLYIEKLTDELMHTYLPNDDRIQTQVEIPDMELDVDTLVPLGLIINELITNSMKYAFPDGRKGRLQISIQPSGKNFVVEVKDDGVGFDLAKINPNSFGNKLISSLCIQLQGQLDLEIKGGTLVRLTIPKDQS